MRSLSCLFVGFMVFMPIDARAQQSPVVLELFTSQGCSSCPPADALLSQLADTDGVIALALHIDYWDYLGWKDSFGKKAYTKRQKGYAKALRKRSIYTPQMIVQGEDRMVGHDVESIMGSIRAHQARAPRIDLDVSRKGSVLLIDLAPRTGPVGPADIHVVRTTPEHFVAIEAGENAGHEINYTNIVTDWTTVGEWDGASEVTLRIDDVGTDPLAVIVQRARHGPIVAAAELP